MRAALVVAGAAGVLLVVLATFATVIEITVAGNANITADVDRTASGWDRHNVGLLLLAGFALVMLVGALRGGRPAMFALGTCGLAVLLIAVVGDAPDLDKTGPIGELYEDARAEAGSGFYFETLGGALLLIAGVGLLLLGAGGGSVRTARMQEVAVAADEPSMTPGGARLAAPRTGSGAASAVSRAREAAAARAAARRDRTQARREREQAAKDRARERAEASPAAEPAEADAATGSAKLSFDERLRQARERARRKP